MAAAASVAAEEEGAEGAEGAAAREAAVMEVVAAPVEATVLWLL